MTKKNDVGQSGVENNERRKAIKRTAASSAAVTLAAASGKWQKPIIDSVLLPAHAATSLPIQNMRLTVHFFVSDDNPDVPTSASPSATAGSTADYLNSDSDDDMGIRAKIHVDPPQATPVTLRYDNATGFDSGPASGVDSVTTSLGDRAFQFRTAHLADQDNPGGGSQTIRAEVPGLPEAVVSLVFSGD